MNTKIEIESWLLVRYYLPIPHMMVDFDVLGNELIKRMPEAYVYVNQHAVLVSHGEGGVYIEIKYPVKGFVPPNENKIKDDMVAALVVAEEAHSEWLRMLNYPDN